MSIERREIPRQFLEHMKKRQELFSFANGQQILLSPKHAEVLRLLQAAEEPLSKEDLKPYFKVVADGIWKLNRYLRNSGYEVKNVSPKDRESQYAYIQTKEDEKKSSDRAKAKKQEPETIEMAKKELVINSSLIILSHLANDLMEKLTHDLTKLLNGAHSNKQIALASVIGDCPKKFLADSLPAEFKRLYNLNPLDKLASAKEKQIVKICNQLKENSWQLQDITNTVFKHFYIQTQT